MFKFCIAIGAALLSVTTDVVVADASRANCDLTQPSYEDAPAIPGNDPIRGSAWYISSDRTIWALWARFRARPEGAIGQKIMWFRPRGTDLRIAGRRLDGLAPPLEVEVRPHHPSELSGSGLRFQPARLRFPTAGCWEVTASAGEHSLRFVTEVAPGPARRSRVASPE